MLKPGIIQRTSSDRIRPSLAYRNGSQKKTGERLFFFFICILITPILICGCSSLHSGFQGKSSFEEADYLFSLGNYKAALNKYEQISENNSASRDRALFDMGIIYSYPKNVQKDYPKALECFHKLTKDYPGSAYKHDSEMMIFNITNVITKDGTITAQQTRIDSLRQEVKTKEKEIITLQQKNKELEQKVLDFATRKRSVDKILIEKRARQLMLLSKGEVIKTYKIALGGNPDGPKERQGDNKTPEGTYVIDSRNRGSCYHLSLHISYPNERDRKRAKKLGVSPGGNIMIHGLKKGYSWVGDSHSDFDWTRGCIAVTDEEIEEIFKLVPLDTVVEIRP